MADNETEVQTPETTVEAPLTDEQKLANALTQVDGLKAKIAEAVAAGEDFTAMAIEYAGAITKHKGLFKTANQGAIDEETSQIANALTTLLGASKLESLMGEPVVSVFYQVTPGEGENGPTISCGINVKARATSTKTKSGGGNTGGGRAAKETYQVDGGALMTPKDFIDAHATEDTRKKSLFSTGKWPTKPDFLDDAVKALEAAGKTVVVAPITE